MTPFQRSSQGFDSLRQQTAETSKTIAKKLLSVLLYLWLFYTSQSSCRTFTPQCTATVNASIEIHT